MDAERRFLRMDSNDIKEWNEPRRDLHLDLDQLKMKHLFSWEINASQMKQVGILQPHSV